MDTDKSRGTLAANLTKLMEKDTPKGAKVSIRAWALGKGLDVRLITRLAKSQNAVTLDTLDQIAAACGLKTWQLLLEDFDPSDPADAPMTEEERKLLRRLRSILSE